MYNCCCSWLVTLRSFVSFWKFHCVLFVCSILIELCCIINVFFSLLFLLVWRFFNCFSGVFVPITCFRERFLQKAIIHFVLPNVLFKVLLMFITCQCLFLAFLVLSNERLYVKEKGIMSARIGLEVFKSNLLLKLSTLLI